MTLKSAAKTYRGIFNFLVNIYENTQIELISDNGRLYVCQSNAHLLTLKYIHITKGILSIIEENSEDIQGYSSSFSFSPLLRAQYEHCAAFYHLFNTSIEDDERWAKFLIWCVAGQKGRTHKIEDKSMDDYTKELFNLHDMKADENIHLLKKTKTYQQLSEKNKINLLQKVFNRNWEIRFNGENCQFVGIDSLFKENNIKNAIIDNLYRFLSISSHSSYGSVMQLSSLEENNKEKLENSLTGIELSFFLTCLQISAYCKFFPSAKDHFDSFHELDKNYINSYLEKLAGKDFII